MIERAGGFTSQAYPYGAVLERTEVREMQEKERAGLVLRVRDAQAELKSETPIDPHQKASNEAAYQQWQTEMESSRKQSAGGPRHDSHFRRSSPLAKHFERHRSARGRPPDAAEKAANRSDNRPSL